MHFTDHLVDRICRHSQRNVQFPQYNCGLPLSCGDATTRSSDQAHISEPLWICRLLSIATALLASSPFIVFYASPSDSYNYLSSAIFKYSSFEMCAFFFFSIFSFVGTEELIAVKSAPAKEFARLDTSSSVSAGFFLALENCLMMLKCQWKYGALNSIGAA